MMKNYRVTVNGVAYDVVVEEVNGSTAAPAAPVTPAPAAVSAPRPVSASVGKAGSISVKAPMPGTLIKVAVNVGDSVKKGDLLCVLEAMKMENDILAPSDGVVASIEASKGSAVTTDAVLVTLN